MGSVYFERSAERLSRYYGLPVASTARSSWLWNRVPRDPFRRHPHARPRRVRPWRLSHRRQRHLQSARYSDRLSTRQRELEATRSLIHKDAQFYIISVLVLFIVFALWATYVFDSTNSAAILPVLTYRVYIFFHQQDASEHISTGAVIRRWVCGYGRRLREATTSTPGL